ncbi:hypothetical protein [Rhodococcus sp. NPDC004095]
MARSSGTPKKSPIEVYYERNPHMRPPVRETGTPAIQDQPAGSETKLNLIVLLVAAVALAVVVFLGWLFLKILPVIVSVLIAIVLIGAVVLVPLALLLAILTK